MSGLQISLLIVGATALLLALTLLPFSLWLTVKFVGLKKLGLIDLISMHFRNVPPNLIVHSLITATKAGLKVTSGDLETHYLAGGNVPAVIKALISAKKASIKLSFQQATAIDLAGRNVFEAVQISVNPEVINTPPVAAVALDGIQLIVKARVTLRAEISRLIGGAGEETILARVGEGIVTAIGSAESHKKVLENPDHISQLVLERGLDKNTAFTILSIDIVDIDVDKNIGASLLIDQANADLRVAEARAEERRAIAVAAAQEAKATVILAEAEVPKALAAALKQGNLGLMDYYRMKNMQADTAMRTTIAK